MVKSYTFSFLNKCGNFIAYTIRTKTLLLYMLCLLCFQKGYSASNTTNDDQPIMKEEIRDENIHTVQFTKAALLNSYPILQLNSQDQLSLQFDVLGTSASKNYQFTVVHCDADWRKSLMLQSDYIDGMFTDYITNKNFSSGTYVRYTHYVINFPSANTRVKLSGNYVIKVFLDDPEKPVLTRRFYVYDQQMRITGSAKRATYSKYSDTKQEINFTINMNGIS